MSWLTKQPMDWMTNKMAWRRAKIVELNGIHNFRREYPATPQEAFSAEIPGALWKREQIDKLRVPRDQLPALTRIVVAVDPSGGDKERNDEVGIVAAGADAQRHGYTLADESGRYSPDTWARKAVALYHLLKADRIVAEANFGGQMVEHTIRTVDPDVPVKLVHASRGKQARAEPIAALAEQGRDHHVGFFQGLEDEMVTWVPLTSTDKPELLGRRQGLGSDRAADRWRNRRCVGPAVVTGDTMPTSVRQQSSAVLKMAEDWLLIDALMGGTNAMRKQSTKFLPKWPVEDQEAYSLRLATATLFPAYARTVSVLVGKPFSKQVTFDEKVPGRVKPWLEDVDREGRNLHTFAAALAEEALSHGLCGILVDAPAAEGVRTIEDEKSAGIRPYFVHIKHDAILGWRIDTTNGGARLKQLRLLESVEEDDGEFGTKTVEQVRVLEPGKWTTYRKVKSDSGQETWVQHQAGTTKVKEIPFVPVYGRRTDFMTGTPPMLELGWANVEHWQSKSDQQTILHVARVPILFGKELGAKTKVAVGSGTMVNASSKDADLKIRRAYRCRYIGAGR